MIITVKLKQVINKLYHMDLRNTMMTILLVFNLKIKVHNYIGKVENFYLQLMDTSFQNKKVTLV